MAVAELAVAIAGQDCQISAPPLLLLEEHLLDPKFIK